MKPRSTLLLFFLTGIAILSSGCEEKLTPLQVSEHFWKGIEQKDPALVSKYISSDSRVDTDSMENILTVTGATFGRTVIEADRAWVDTSVKIESEEPFTLPLATVLVMQDGYWKVDYDETVVSITSGSEIAKVISGMRDLGGRFADELDKSLGEMQKAIPEIKREIGKVEEEIRSRIPELQKRMEEFMKQLEEALKNPPTQPQKPPQENNKAIEI